MDWNEEIDLSTRKMTSQLVIKRAMARGWKVCGFKTSPAIFLVQPPNSKPIKIFSASPPQMSYPSVKIAKDKYITNQILNMSNVPVPKELLINVNEFDEKKAEEFISLCGKVVVKPLDASHGKGITVDVDSLSSLIEAFGEAKRNTDKSYVVVQEQLSGVDLRVLCINYKYVNAISRLPASVIGDGEHSVKELVEITNRSDQRGENYKAKLNVIPMIQVSRYLSEEELSSVPDNNKEVQVIGVSNIGMGGIRLNVSDLLPEFIKKMAEEASKIINLPVCGVDFIVKSQPNEDSTIEELQPKIIEVNECPMLTMYDDLKSKEQENVIDQYLDYVASSEI